MENDQNNLKECPDWNDVKDEFEFLWNEYAMCPESRLAKDAIELKRNLIALGTDTRSNPTPATAEKASALEIGKSYFDLPTWVENGTPKLVYYLGEACGGRHHVAEICPHLPCTEYLTRAEEFDIVEGQQGRPYYDYKRVKAALLQGSTNHSEELVKAAQDVIDRWDSPNWKDLPGTAQFINSLRNQLKAHKSKGG